jgi:mono/diheme cytochrome c family protein
LAKSGRLACVVLLTFAAVQAEEPIAPPPAAPPVAASPAPAVATATSVDLVDTTPKGQLHNRYTDDDALIVEAGRKLYFHFGCNGCHGGTGGGGMCPPVTNDVWVYGGDDDTLFRLVTLGSDDLQNRGYVRKGSENVVGPMPPMGAIVTTADDLWRIFAFIRANYHGAPESKFGAPAEPAPPQ